MSEDLTPDEDIVTLEWERHGIVGTAQLNEYDDHDWQVQLYLSDKAMGASYDTRVTGESSAQAALDQVLDDVFGNNHVSNFDV